jgi:hypothetical protein
MLLPDLRDFGHLSEEAIAGVQPAEEGLEGLRRRYARG